MRCALVAVVLATASHGGAMADATLPKKQEQAREQRAELRARLKLLQQQIERQEASRDDADLALKKSEAAISVITHRLAQLQSETADTAQELEKLEKDTTQQKTQLNRRRDELSRQLRAQYTSGLSPWMALLSGDDPRIIGRDLSYLSYVSSAQAQVVRDVSDAVAQLQALQTQTKRKKDELSSLASLTTERQAELETQKTKREAILARIESELQEQRGQATRLIDNEARLGQLIRDLGAEIALQIERERKAEEKRRAEAERRAEAARQAALEQQRALDQERQKSRIAEQAAQDARQSAKRESLEREAAQARLQVERARAEADEADKAATERRADVSSLRGEAAGAGQLGAMDGLTKNLPRPVRGDVLGRFGAQRPEGGVWRGIVLRSPEGTHVRAIAPGRVVYASWLSGFGNIIIVDHGKHYLSVYAYNQSLLKDVDDAVGAGDVVATVGATGGQVEPGLYFEIRHQGKPVNPLLWLKP